jgi:hypothetical protein
MLGVAENKRSLKENACCEPAARRPLFTIEQDPPNRSNHLFLGTGLDGGLGDLSGTGLVSLDNGLDDTDGDGLSHVTEKRVSICNK